MSTEQKTRQLVYNTSRKISKEIATNFNMECDPDALEMIAELTYRKLQTYGADLDAFQKHAKRSTITADDVKLLVRRNESLRQMVDSKLQAINDLRPSPDSGTGPKRKRKTTSSTS